MDRPDDLRFVGLERQFLTEFVDQKYATESDEAVHDTFNAMSKVVSGGNRIIDLIPKNRRERRAAATTPPDQSP